MVNSADPEGQSNPLPEQKYFVFMEKFVKKKKKKYNNVTRAVVGQRSSPAGYILYCNIFIIKPYNIGHTDLDVFVCKSFCHIDIIIRVWQFSMK